MTRTTIALFLALLLALAAAPAAHAIGTAAGTAITNQAYADYTDSNGNPMTRVFSNVVTTIVAQVGAVQLAPDSGAVAAANGGTASFLVQIFNRGNGSDSFDYSFAVTSGWIPTSLKLHFDDHARGGAMHVYDAGIDPEIPLAGTTEQVASDDDYDTILLVTVPSAATAPDASQCVITVTATSKFDGTKTTVGTYTVTVSAAAITGFKTVSSSYPKPGQTETYTITYTNSGTADGTDLVMTDPIPAGMTYKPGTLKLNGVAKTDAADGDGADFNITAANSITVNIGTVVKSGGQAVVAFDVTLQPNLAAGTPVTNQASFTYKAGATTINALTNGLTLFVGTASAMDVATAQTVASGDPGSTVVYPLTFANNGNSADTIDITAISSSGFAWVFWFDANGDGVVGPGDTLLTDTDGDGKIDTGSIPAGETKRVIAVTTIPAGTANGTVDTATFTGTSSNDGTVTDSVTVTTTVSAPALAMTKTVSPAGAQPPGAELTYTVTLTNHGVGIADNVFVTDPIPARTTYVPGSLKFGPSAATLAAKTDADDADKAKFDSGSRAVIVGGTGYKLGAGASLVVQFKVTID